MTGSRSQDQSVDVLVEIPRGSRQKYELDKKTGRIRLDRVLFSSVHYPADYGFVMQTLACIVPARPIGTLLMSDERGDDEKILAVPTGDPRFAEVRDLDDLPKHWLREIETFFATYTDLEDKEPPKIRGWRGAAVARGLIAQARKRAGNGRT